MSRFQALTSSPVARPSVRTLRRAFALKARACFTGLMERNPFAVCGCPNPCARRRAWQGWGLANSAGTGVFATEELLESILAEVKERRRVLVD
jgi:hypothetical protein